MSLLFTSSLPNSVGKNGNVFLAFLRTSSCQQAFDQLKCLLTRAPVLAYPDFKHDYIPVSIPDFPVSPPPTLSSKLSIHLAVLPVSSNRHSAVLSIVLLSSSTLLLLVDGGCRLPPCRPLPLLDLVEFTLFAPS